MTLPEAIEQLLQGNALTRDQARDVMDQVMAGEVFQNRRLLQPMFEQL